MIQVTQKGSCVLKTNTFLTKSNSFTASLYFFKQIVQGQNIRKNRATMGIS